MINFDFFFFNQIINLLFIININYFYFYAIFFTEDSNVYANNMVRQHNFLKKLVEEIDESSEKVTLITIIENL